MKHLISILILSVFSLHLSAGNPDYRLLADINHIDNRFIHNASDFLSNSAPYIAVGIPAILGGYSLIKKDKELFYDAVYIGSSVCEAVILSYAVKHTVRRDRPYEKHHDIIRRDNVGKYSFPSSHTATAFSLATSLSIRYPKWYVIAPSMVWAGSVGFARMYEGVHYPSDVLCGAILGAGSAWLNHKLNQWLVKKYDPKVKRYF